MTKMKSFVFGIVCVLPMLISVGNAGATNPTCSSIGWSPNEYAIGYQLTDAYYGVQAVISTASPSVPHSSHDFSDEAVHIYDVVPGQEVGWYVGWGSDNQLYVNDPHAYATLNSSNEVDGIDVLSGGNNTFYWYTTWVSGSTIHYRVDDSVGGTVLWSGTISGSTSPGPGAGAAIGETLYNTIPMGPSTFSDIQQLNSNGTWSNWLGDHLCNDSPYTETGISANKVKNS